MATATMPDISKTLTDLGYSPDAVGVIKMTADFVVLVVQAGEMEGASDEMKNAAEALLRAEGQFTDEAIRALQSGLEGLAGNWEASLALGRAAKGNTKHNEALQKAGFKGGWLTKQGAAIVLDAMKKPEVYAEMIASEHVKASQQIQTQVLDQIKTDIFAMPTEEKIKNLTLYVAKVQIQHGMEVNGVFDDAVKEKLQEAAAANPNDLKLQAFSIMMTDVGDKYAPNEDVLDKFRAESEQFEVALKSSIETVQGMLSKTIVYEAGGKYASKELGVWDAEGKTSANYTTSYVIADIQRLLGEDINGDLTQFSTQIATMLGNNFKDVKPEDQEAYVEAKILERIKASSLDEAKPEKLADDTAERISVLLNSMPIIVLAGKYVPDLEAVAQVRENALAPTLDGAKSDQKLSDEMPSDVELVKGFLTMMGAELKNNGISGMTTPGSGESFDNAQTSLQQAMEFLIHPAVFDINVDTGKHRAMYTPEVGKILAEKLLAPDDDNTNLMAKGLKKAMLEGARELVEGSVGKEVADKLDDKAMVNSLIGSLDNLSKAGAIKEPSKDVIWTGLNKQMESKQKELASFQMFITAAEKLEEMMPGTLGMIDSMLRSIIGFGILDIMEFLGFPVPEGVKIPGLDPELSPAEHYKKVVGGALERGEELNDVKANVAELMANFGGIPVLSTYLKYKYSDEKVLMEAAVEQANALLTDDPKSMEAAAAKFEEVLAANAIRENELRPRPSDEEMRAFEKAEAKASASSSARSGSALVGNNNDKAEEASRGPMRSSSSNRRLVGAFSGGAMTAEDMVAIAAKNQVEGEDIIDRRSKIVVQTTAEGHVLITGRGEDAQPEDYTDELISYLRVKDTDNFNPNTAEQDFPKLHALAKSYYHEAKFRDKRGAIEHFRNRLTDDDKLRPDQVNTDKTPFIFKDRLDMLLGGKVQLKRDGSGIVVDSEMRNNFNDSANSTPAPASQDKPDPDPDPDPDLAPNVPGR